MTLKFFVEIPKTLGNLKKNSNNILLVINIGTYQSNILNIEMGAQ